MMRWLSLWALLASPLAAQDVYFLGEVHDNPHHHQRQAELTQTISPKALVFEMLTSEQAQNHAPGLTQEDLDAALGWSQSPWPDFAYYYPIFAAAPGAQVFGAGLPRAQLRALMQKDLPTAFGKGAETFGLADPLSQDDQTLREAYQQQAHCNALPPEMLPMMVDMQRLRDAELAKVAQQALDLTGGPVVVITGNGHARADWGAPVYLAKANPGVQIETLGQGEGGTPPDGKFDIIETSAPIPEREDPCLAFKK